jgi:hypothetical protein
MKGGPASMTTWLPLLVAALGIVGTIGGTVTGAVLAQRHAARRDDIAWTRERERERERWAREDAARTFNERRDAYANFYESLRDMTFFISQFGRGWAGNPDSHGIKLPFNFQRPTHRRLQHVYLYAAPATAHAASDAYSAACRWGNRVRFGQPDEQFHAAERDFDAAEVALREAIRADLGIPDTISLGGRQVAGTRDAFTQDTESELVD